MYHSLTFNSTLSVNSNNQFTGTNTWTNWHLIPSKRPSVAPPVPSIKMVDVPGRSGSIDMTNYLTGGIVYGNRSGSWEFYVDNDHENWVTIKEKITSYLNGKHLYVCLEDEPQYYYEARFSLNEWRSEPTNSMVVINYVLLPARTKFV